MAEIAQAFNQPRVRRRQNSIVSLCGGEDKEVHVRYDDRWDASLALRPDVRSNIPRGEISAVKSDDVDSLKQEPESCGLAACSSLKQIRRAGEKTIAEAKEEYEVYLRDEKQNKERSYTATLWRLGKFFPDEELSLSALTPPKCAGYYRALRSRETKYGKPVIVPSIGETSAIS